MDDVRYKEMLETTDLVKEYLLNYLNSTKLTTIDKFNTDFYIFFLKETILMYG